MNIVLQIISLIFSFLFGFSFALVIGLFYRLIYSKKKIVCLISSLILVLFAVAIYFIGLRKINNAIFHIYEIISIVVGYALESLISLKIAKRKNRWYNFIIGEYIIWLKKYQKHQNVD